MQMEFFSLDFLHGFCEEFMLLLLQFLQFKSAFTVGLLPVCDTDKQEKSKTVYVAQRQSIRWILVLHLRMQSVSLVGYWVYDYLACNVTAWMNAKYFSVI